MSPLDPKLQSTQGIFGDAGSGSSTVMQSNPFSGASGIANAFTESGPKGSSTDDAAPSYFGPSEDGLFVFGASLAPSQEPTLPSSCEVGGTRRRAAASRMRRCREQRAAQGWGASSQTSPMAAAGVASGGAEDSATGGCFEPQAASQLGSSAESTEAGAEADMFDVPMAAQQGADVAAAMTSGVEAPAAAEEPARIFRFGMQFGASSSTQQEPTPGIFRFGAPPGASSSTDCCSGSGVSGTTSEPSIFRFGVQPQQHQQERQQEAEHTTAAMPQEPASSLPEACASAPAMASPDLGHVFSFGGNSTVPHVPWGGAVEAAQPQSPLPAATFVPVERRVGGAERRRHAGQRRHIHEDLQSEDAEPFSCSDALDSTEAAASTMPAAPSLSWQACMTLEEARSHAKQQNFVEALQACLSVLSGPQEAMKLLQQICRSWDKAGEDRIREHEEEMRSRMSQLMAARDRSETLRRLKEKMEVDLQNEKHRREDSQEQYAWLRRQYDEVLRENKKLKQQPAREAYNAYRARSAAPPREEVVRQMAEFECCPLRQCSSESRVAIKKKLLLKWHPDKQPSMENAALATAVMQELQNRPEWDE